MRLSTAMLSLISLITVGAALRMLPGQQKSGEQHAHPASPSASWSLSPSRGETVHEDSNAALRVEHEEESGVFWRKTARSLALTLLSDATQGFNLAGHGASRFNAVLHRDRRHNAPVSALGSTEPLPLSGRIFANELMKRKRQDQVKKEETTDEAFDIRPYAVSAALLVTLVGRTFALKTVSADPGVNMVLGLRFGEETLGAFLRPPGQEGADGNEAQADPDAAVDQEAALAEIPTWFAWDLVELAALLRVLTGIATVKALEVAPMPVFGVVSSLEPGMAFLLLMAWDCFTNVAGGKKEGQAAKKEFGLPDFGAQELGLLMLIVGAAVTKFGDLETELYVYGLCFLKAIASAGEDVAQDEARREAGLNSPNFLPVLFKRVLPLNAVVVLLSEILPTLADPDKTLFPEHPSTVVLFAALLQPFIGWLAQLLWFETNRVSGDPVITMSLQPPKDAMVGFFVPGSFAHMGPVAMVGYVLNLLGVGVYAKNSARGKERRAELAEEEGA